MFWLWYTAMEPFVRRLWPEVLISWSRLLEGRWRDPLVGRSLLTGCLFGLVQNLVHQAHLLAPPWLGGAMSQFQPSHPWALSTPASLLATCLLGQFIALSGAMFLLMSLLLQLLFRKRVSVLIAFVAIFTSVFMWVGVVNPVVDWLATALLTGLSLWLLVQWGFLASVVAALCGGLLAFPLTCDLSQWYASHGLLGAGLVAALALFGFYTSKAASPLLSEAISAKS